MSKTITILILTIILGYLNMYAVMVFGWGIDPTSHWVIFFCFLGTVILTAIQTIVTNKA